MCSGNGSMSRERHFEDNRDHGCRGETGIAKKRVQHRPILFIESAVASFGVFYQEKQRNHHFSRLEPLTKPII